MLLLSGVFLSIMHQFFVWVFNGMCLPDLHCVLHAHVHDHTHTISVDAEVFALHAEAAEKVGYAICMHAKCLMLTL